MTPGFRPSSPARCRGRIALSIAHSQQLHSQTGCQEQAPLLKLSSIGLTSALSLEVLLVG